MLPKRVSATYLADLGACSEEVARFRKLHRRGLPLSWLSCQVAAGEGFDLDWFAFQALPPPALKAYDEATEAAWKAYDEATAPARKAYSKATETAWKAYYEAIAPARKAYYEATGPALKAYDEARATALWEALKIDLPLRVE